MDYYQQKVNEDKEKEILAWGQFCDLDQCEKAYLLGGMSVTWSDYTYDWFNALPQSEQMERLDDAWDMDAYYDDFYKWWSGLSTEKRETIYNAVNNN